MCRLVGYVAREPATVTKALGTTLAELSAISHHHGDGWGLAWYNKQGRLQQEKAPEPAYASEVFSHVVETIETDALIGHVRWASPGFALCMENTHPFTRDLRAFAHNGSIAPNETIEELIAPDLRTTIVGSTDSERYFLALLSALEAFSPVEAFQIVLNTLRQRLQSTSLNCLLLTPETLFAVCDFDPNAPLAQKDADYFHLLYQVRSERVIVRSTGLGQDSTGWETLKNGQMLLVERGTLRVTIVYIAENARNSLQEQYLSLLQR
jgi:predicted glutamine amidotransferase